jgi:nucleoside transporter
VRVFGTFGWIAANVAIDVLLPAGSDITNRPLLLAAGLSAALGVFSFVLPHTPPTGRPGDALPFVKAVGLLRDPSFAIFFGVAFAVAIALAFYYGFTGVYLGDMGVERIASVMSLGQVSEVVFMLLLPFAIKYIGMKAVLGVGIGAWVVRYGLFSTAADGKAFPLLVLGVLLHGVCFDFFLAAGFIYTDNKAPASIRGSAQALFSFLVYGVGMWIGNLLSGRVVDAYTVNGAKQWDKIWLVPAAGAAVCLLVFLILWKDRKGKLELDPEPRGFAVEPVTAYNGDVGPGAAIEPVGTNGDARR